MSNEVTTRQNESTNGEVIQNRALLAAGATLSPDVDILESEDALRLWVDVPGVDPDAIDVRLDHNLLTIQGRFDTEPFQGLEPVYSEYPLGNFERRFRISDALDGDRIEARVDAGVLELTLPKSESARPRRIEVVSG